ncbi:MAG: hypothetical protein ABIT16_06090 [Croceibacterium sp.]
MNSLFAILTPLALLLPAIAGEPQDAAPQDQAAQATPTEEPRPAMGLDPGEAKPFRALSDAWQPQTGQQVRIEERVIIRIAPSNPAAREQMLALLPRRNSSQSSFREAKLDGCIAISDIAGVQPAEQNRLLLFMRDHRVLTAALDRACKAEDFYAGFYVERRDDGQLCARRDMLQSRSGASCKVSQLNRLVATRE